MTNMNRNIPHKQSFASVSRPNLQRYLLLVGLLLCLIYAPFGLNAQKNAVPQLISYQAVARSADGALMAEQSIQVRFSFSTRDGSSEVYYSEIHEVNTQQDGQFDLMIGAGVPQKSTFSAIPWSKPAIYLGVELAEGAGKPFKLVSRSQMMAVPYAFVAERAATLSDSTALSLRNQSIHWLTAGNDDSRPPVHFIGTRDNQDLVVKTANTTRAIFTKEGQMQVYSGVGAAGVDTNPDDYPITVEGGNQGIYIKVNGSRNGDNNFLTFADDTQVWGRVEGETWAEIQASEDYAIQVALYTLQGVSLVLQVAAEVAGAVAYASSGYGAGAAPPTVANGIILGTQAADLIAEAIVWATDLEQNQGVAYATGKGDYAEYMKRSIDSRDLFAGEVVGISGGMISSNTQNAEHLRIISTSPAIIGNKPAKEEEAAYEKVAYMGQVHVRVAGAANAGDYILPSGNNDGLAIAVAPENMKIGDYKNIIGVSWETVPLALVNYVNTAIGIQANDLGYELDAMNRKVQRIYDYLDGKTSIEELASMKNKSAADTPDNAAITAAWKSVDDADFDKIIDEHADIFIQVFKGAEEQLKSRDYDYSHMPQLQELFDDPITVIKQLRRNPDFFSQWAILDHQLEEFVDKK